MAVSKIAVMALVGILAIPILLGYALNLSEVTETDYRPDGDNINVTPLLQTSSAYTSVNADIYQINSSFSSLYGDIAVSPYYNNVGGTVTPYPLYRYNYDNVELPTTLYPSYGGFYGYLDQFNYYYWQLVEQNDTGYLNLKIIDEDDNSIYSQYQRMRSVYWDSTRSNIYVSYYQSDSFDSFSTSVRHVLDNHYYFEFTPVGNYDSYSFLERSKYTDNTDYADISDGYKFIFIDGFNGGCRILLPDRTRSTLMTIDLDSVTEPNISLEIGSQAIVQTLNKTTVGDVVTWQVVDQSNGNTYDLYYDPNGNNTYQMFLEMKLTNMDESINTAYYDVRLEYRYIGSWPDIIGVANAYKTTTIEKSISIVNPGHGGNLGIRHFWIAPLVGDSVTTPTIRMDRATFDAFQYPIIQNKTYSPADFKSNPTTTIESVNKYGTSIEFGGNTYTVDNSGNITLGSHNVSVSNLKLESIPVPVGYENRINGNVISVTAEPSTIKFNGQWGASVSTIGNVATTYTKTEWVAGQFAWDGIDTNFLIVGLITCFGVFIALGIYVRKSGKGMIPLILVCGGAVTLFICMI